MKSQLLSEYLERRSNYYTDKEFKYGMEEGFDYGFDICFEMICDYLHQNCKIERNDWALGNAAAFLERKKEEIMK